MSNNLENNAAPQGEYKDQLLLKLNETAAEVRTEIDKGLQRLGRL